MAGVEFRILGDLEVSFDGEPAAFGGPKLRILLATLLLEWNRTVRLADLTERLWHPESHGSARTTVQTYVQRLRRLLDTPERLVTVGNGYRILAEQYELDLARFRSAVARTQQLSVPAEKAELLREALSQWHGRPLANIHSEVIQTVDVPRLEEEWLDTAQQRFDLELQLGRHLDVVRELPALAGAHPTREDLHGQWMLALYRSGRQAEALGVFHQIRNVLAEQLGIDPNKDLQRLYQRILNEDPGIDRPVAHETILAPSIAVPRELPADIGDFVGREDVEARLVGALRSGPRSMFAISGQPGIGKTAFAVHIAHEVGKHFPDGQLYADLEGYSATQPVTAVQVLARFVVALGVSAHQVPVGREELIALYRTLLADRRVLVVLDNAADPAQVRPLLPTAGGSAAIVTSRNQLRGLTALQGVHAVHLEVLSAEQGLTLLSGILGEQRVRAELDEAAELVELCGFLPLAIRIAAANLYSRAYESIHAYIRELNGPGRLASFDIEGDEEATLRAAFDLSYSHLAPRAARVFRLLGALPGQDFTIEMAAAFLGSSFPDTARLLDHLAAASLVSHHSSGRLWMHDLIRLYAIERCEQEEPTAELSEARGRIVDFYFRKASAAAELTNPMRARLPPSPDEIRPETEFADASEATRWFDAECPNLIATIREVRDTAHREQVVRLAEAIRPHLFTNGRHLPEALVAYRALLQSAIESDDVHTEAAMHHAIGALLERSLEHAPAIHHFTRELRAHRISGSVPSQARALISLGNVLYMAGELEKASARLGEGIQLAGQVGEEPLVSFGKLNQAAVESRRGRLYEAEQVAREAIAINEHSTARATADDPRRILGETLVQRGAYREATRELRLALESLRATLSPYCQAVTQSQLAVAHDAIGDVAIAQRYAQDAFETAREQGALDEEAEVMVALVSVDPDMAWRARHDALERAVQLCHRVDHRYMEATALCELAELYVELREHGQARMRARESMVISEDFGYLVLHGRAELALARAELSADAERTAVEHAERAVTVFARTGALVEHARGLIVLGTAKRALGAGQEARDSWQQALRCLADTDLPEDAELVVSLHSLLDTDSA
ncbi:AfsR/SARP family transcriptional regulator [Sciscionella marina]|uniref:AfsR/SARP family transcriptional regulator n=1 Tax=Sciscionella marina TaxID=508770 RepID=UPI00037724CF|nr:BTAD domain-containing putative transcriptional regulator [Sciscionella marina]